MHKLANLANDSLFVPLGHNDVTGLAGQLWGDSFRRFRQTEAFKQFIREAGVFAHWQEHRYPPLCRPVGDDDFDCD